MPSKRSHGEGTLRHRSDGRWELRMMDGYQKDGSPRFKTFYGKTQKEVKLKLKEYQDALISGVQLDTILYFEDWADTWFEGHKDNIAPTTQESYKYCLKIRPFQAMIRSFPMWEASLPALCLYVFQRRPFCL